MFSSHSRTRVLQIKFQLANLKKANLSVTDYFQKVKGMADTLTTAIQPFDDLNIISHLLASLSSDFDVLPTSITTYVEPISLNEVYSNLEQQTTVLLQPIQLLKASQTLKFIISDLILLCITVAIILRALNHSVVMAIADVVVRLHFLLANQLGPFVRFAIGLVILPHLLS